MFLTLSGAGFHVGHPHIYRFDIYSRYKRLKGFNVLHPMGYDAFGLASQNNMLFKQVNTLLKTTEKNISRYREQMDQLGFSFDWDREVGTCDSKYYH